MSFKLSTNLREQIMIAGFKPTMDSCTLKIYGGVEPVDADTEIGAAVLLCEVTNGGSPVTFEAAAPNGLVQKNILESWAGTNLATGTATFYRLELAADDQSTSTAFNRAQGKVGVVGEQLNLSDVGLINGIQTVIDFYSVLLP